MSVALTCEACGKTYPLTEKLLGKKVRCKCGQVMAAPAQMPDAGDYDLAEDDFVEAAPKPKGRRCGTCGRAVAAEAVICVACGTDFRTGKKVGEGPAPREAEPAQTAFGVPGAAAKTVQVGEARDPRKTVYILVGVFVAVTLFIAGVTVVRQLGERRDATAGMVEEDVVAQEKLDEGYPAEAREWLENDRHMLIGHTPNQAEARVDKLYDLGARKVWAFGAGMSLSLVVDLPTDPAQREALFEYRRRYYEQALLPAPEDEGQDRMVFQLR